jgi:hypothetical protein
VLILFGEISKNQIFKEFNFFICVGVQVFYKKVSRCREPPATCVSYVKIAELVVACELLLKLITIVFDFPRSLAFGFKGIFNPLKAVQMKATLGPTASRPVCLGVRNRDQFLSMF